MTRFFKIFVFILLFTITIPTKALAFGEDFANLKYIVHTKNQISDELASGKFKQIFQNTNLGNWYETNGIPQSQLQNILQDNIITIEPENKITTSGIVISQLINYNDPWFTNNPEITDKQWALPATTFIDAWKKTTGTKDVVVAIIDTGIDTKHEDLINANFVSGFDVENNKIIIGDQNVDDNGHGTLIAGVIAATAGNSKGIAGAAPGVSIMPIKALDSEGNGTSASVSSAIVWAADNGASVINLSLGGIGFSHDTILANSVEYAYRKGVVVVSAAGNDAAKNGGSLDTNPVFPICNDNGENMVLGVTAVDSKNIKPEFANFGKACVDVSSPGRRIISTINHDPVTGSYSPNSYAFASGTSLAVPFVSSQAALLKSLYKDASPRQIMDRITSTAKKIDALNLSQCAGFPCDGLIGAGLIQVASSMEAPILPKFTEGDLARTESNTLYVINGGKRRLVIPLVFEQRFRNKSIIPANSNDLSNFSEGAPMEPLDGTLIQKDGESTVYYMEKGVKLPVTYQIFIQRNFQFSQVKKIEPTYVNSWLLGNFLTPKEGTLVKGAAQTVYWTVGGSLHPINYNFWKSMGLSIFPIMRISEQDLKGQPKGEAYIK